MHLKKLFCLTIIVFLITSLFSQESEKQNNKNEFSFSTTLDLAYSPENNYIPGPTHYSPITGTYSSFAGRIIGLVNYNIHSPLGNHWLLKDANFNVKTSTELTPVTLKQEFSADFTPFPFLVLNSGIQIGTGWKLLDIQGLALQNTNPLLTDNASFSALLIKLFIEATIQFDTAAIWEGPWHHFQLMYTFQTYYTNVNTATNGSLWIWQGNKNNVNGLSYYHTLIAAFQMPIFLSRVGVMFEAEGHFANSDYNAILYPSYNGTFTTCTISPLAQFTIGKRDQITFLFSFSSRRSFIEPHTKTEEEPFLTFSGQEWFFYRCVLRWVHNF